LAAFLPEADDETLAILDEINDIIALEFHSRVSSF